MTPEQIEDKAGTPSAEYAAEVMPIKKAKVTDKMDITLFGAHSAVYNAHKNGYITGYNQALQDIQQQQMANMDAEEQHITIVNQRREQNRKLHDHAAEYVTEEDDQERRTNDWIAGYNRETEIYNRNQEDNRYYGE